MRLVNRVVKKSAGFAERRDKCCGFAAGSYFHEHIEADDIYRSNVSLLSALVANAADGSGTSTGTTRRRFQACLNLDRQISSLTAGGKYQTDENSKIVVNGSILRARYDEQFWADGNHDGVRQCCRLHRQPTHDGEAISTGSDRLIDPTFPGG